MIKETNNKRRHYRSRLESYHGKILDKIFKNRKATVSFESEKLVYTLTKRYLPDFIVEFPSGHKMYIETKGYLRPSDRTKLRAVKACNPGIDLRMVMGANNKLSKTSTLRYGDWCDRNGIPWAVNEVPKDWCVNR